MDHITQATDRVFVEQTIPVERNDNVSSTPGESHATNVKDDKKHKRTIDAISKLPYVLCFCCVKDGSCSSFLENLISVG